MPRSPTPLNTAVLQVGGEAVTQYRYKLNGGLFSDPVGAGIPITFEGLRDGTNTLVLLGGNSSNVFQSESSATVVQWVFSAKLPAVRLNEILANPSGNLSDQIELYNEGLLPVDVGGLCLSDDSADLTKFRIPSGTSLGPGAYLVFSENQLGFALNASGETIYLTQPVEAGGALLDSVEFGDQLADLSLGRLGSGGEWQLCRPTLGFTNVATEVGSAKGVRINEWSAVGVAPTSDDFIEIYNPQFLPVVMGGFSFTDEPIGNPRKNVIRANTFIPPNTFAVFKSGDGKNDLNFNLAGEQGQIALFDPSLIKIDHIVYGPQRLGLTSGRCPGRRQTR